MLPLYEDISLPLLLEIAERGGKTRPSDHRAGKNVYKALAEVFKLTREDLDVEVEGPPRESKWENMVRWVRKALVDGGYIDGSEWGAWKLTEKGWQAAKSRKMAEFSIEKTLKKTLSKLSPESKSELLEKLKEVGLLK